MKFKKINVQGWCKTNKSVSQVINIKEENNIFGAIDYAKDKGLKICSRGAGNSYGDSATINKGIVLDFKNFNKIIKYNKHEKTIVCQSGTSIGQLLNITLKDNLTLCSIPGSPQVTVGGCISHNVHGKDSHINGAFGNNVMSIKIITSSKEMLTFDLGNEIGKKNANYVIGGIGLFGIIVEAKLKLVETHQSIYVKRIIFNNINKITEIYKKNKKNHITIWVDTFSKNLRGFAEIGEYKNSKIITNIKNNNIIINNMLKIQKLINFKLNSFFVKLFNFQLFYTSLIFNKNKYKNLINYYFPFGQVPNHHSYFPEGMYEIQIFIPNQDNITNIKNIFQILKKYKIYSWLSGIKYHKKENFNFSFCNQGISVSLNFSGKQVNEYKFSKMFEELNSIVKQLNGRYNLSKDFLIKDKDFMTQNYFAKHLNGKKYLDPNYLFSSDLNKRLKILSNE